MLKLQIALRRVGDSTDLLGYYDSLQQKIVADARRGNVTVGLSEECNPLSVRIRDVQDMDDVKDIVQRFDGSQKLSSAEIEKLGRLCNQYMTTLASAYREKYASVEMAC